MKHIKFTIGKTRHNTFIRQQVAKIQAGIDLFRQVLKQEDFRDSILSFAWTGQAGKRYHRFIGSQHLSNLAVWKRIENGSKFFKFDTNSPCTIAILPCQSRKEMTPYLNISRPTIWLHQGYLNQDWYTPIHVASALMHEYCDNLGFPCTINKQQIDNLACTIPFFCGYQVLHICQKWQYAVTEIQTSLEYIDENNYQYFPCSVVFDMYKSNAAWQPANQKITELIDLLQVELDSLIQVENPSSSRDLMRFQALKKSMQELEKLQLLLKDSSLDGVEGIIEKRQEEIS